MNISPIRAYSVENTSNKQNFKGIEKCVRKDLVNLEISGKGRIGDKEVQGYFMGKMLPPGVKAQWDNLKKTFKNINLCVIGLGSMDLKKGKTLESLSDDAIIDSIRRDNVAGSLPDGIKFSVERIKDDPNAVFLHANSPFAEDGEEIIYMYAGHDLRDTSRYNIDYVYDATGKRTKDEALQEVFYKQPGIKRVFLSAPGETDDIATYMAEMNTDTLKADVQKISTASCTTTSMVPVLDAFQKSPLGMLNYLATTTHSLTATQKGLDGANKSSSKKRGSVDAIVPASSGASKAVGRVKPELKGIGGCFALRVPTTDVSATTLTILMNGLHSKEEVMEVLAKYSKEHPDRMAIATEGSISKDMIGNTANCIVIPEYVTVSKDMVSIPVWYDNEGGYAKNSMDVVKEYAERIDIPAKQ